MSAHIDRTLRIILADDHPIFLIGLRVVLEQDNRARVIAQAGSPNELLQLLHSQACDIVVTDFMMPTEQQNDGLRLLERIRRDFPDLPVVVVTTLNNAALFRNILQLKVQGLLGKASVASELPAAIASVRQRWTYVSDSVRRTLHEAENYVTDPVNKLSPRELEVMRMLASGQSVMNIAHQLNRSKQTVSAQKISAMRKLGLANDAALFLYLQENGLY